MADENAPIEPENTEPAPSAAGEDPAAGPTAKKTAKKAAAKKTTAAKKTAAKKTAAKKTAAKKAATKKTADTTSASDGDTTTPDPTPADVPAGEAPPAAPRKRASRKKATAPAPTESGEAAPSADRAGEQVAGDAAGAPGAPLFQAPDVAASRKPRRATKKAAGDDPAADATEDDAAATEQSAPAAAPAGSTETDGAGSGADASAEGGETQSGETEGGETEGGETGGRRRRRRGGRRRRKSGGDGEQDAAGADTETAADDGDTAEGGDADGKNGQDGKDDKDDKDEKGEGGSSSSRRRRRRRREGDGGGGADGDPQNTVTRVRKGRSAEDEITAVSGSTRLEAKKQRRREGREAGRRRAPIVSEAEFLARRESVDRVMAVRQRDDLTQIAVLEDKVLVEHYVARESQTSLIGDVYLGRVQNVLPSMEAAFIDIGKGRNAVLYAGEVNWSALGHKDGTPRRIESVLSSGQTVLVQVTKDPVGQKGARLTSQISLPGRFLVYVPDGTTSGISRKLPDTERTRLKTLLKEIVPDSAGVIVRTAAEGASEEELTRDVERLKARWESVEAKARSGAPKLLYGEPDLTLKVVRDLFTEDFSRLVVQGAEVWQTVHDYVADMAPDLEDRVERHDPDAEGAVDVFALHRVDEQIAKGVDRKVWLPSGGSLIIDRTEAMTVVDVNTGKFTGSGGNLEETVTKNNLEAAEEIVRQLRLRDIGGIIVVDFIDMVLESNRDLVLRRLVECLGRDRTRHQVAEVTSLGLVQMTRKRIGTGLLEAFSETCDHCGGRGLLVHEMPVEPKRGSDGDNGGGGRGRKRRGRGGGQSEEAAVEHKKPSPQDFAAMARSAQPDGEEGEDGAAVEPGAAVETDAAVETGAAVETDAAEVAADAAVEDAAEAAQEAAEEVEGDAVVAPLAEVEPVDPAPAAQPVQGERSASPRVVTRTRRSANRPAGAAGTAAAVSTTPAPVVVDPAVAPADPADPADPAEPGQPPAPPAPPRVVTRTRGRSANRSAGAPTPRAETDVPAMAAAEDREAASGIGDPPASGEVEPNVGEVEPSSR